MATLTARRSLPPSTWLSPVHKIYSLSDPRDGVVRYVGQTRAPLWSRLSDHIQAAKRGRPKHSPKAAWILDLRALGMKPSISLLEECDGDWREAECRWIASFSDLYNAKRGGGGGSQNRLAELPQAAIDQLGKIADSRIAETLGVSRKAVSYYRKLLGIPASFDRTRNTPPPRVEANLFKPAEIPPECVARLGMVPDYVLGAEFGFEKGVIARRRKRDGIASFAERTGNNGRIRVGEPHRRWTRGTQLFAA